MQRIVRSQLKNVSATADYEKYHYSQGKRKIVGLDEAGRGALAGPVVGAAVYIEPAQLDQIRACDSKLLNFSRREKLAHELADHVKVGIGVASVEEIDSLNILQATFLAWKRALQNLSVDYDWLLFDGNMILPEYNNQGIALIKGDRNCISIAVASIYAKHYRDRIMLSLHEKCPEYAWQQNMGYGTLQHRLCIGEHGLSSNHRKTFKYRLSANGK